MKLYEFAAVTQTRLQSCKLAKILGSITTVHKNKNVKIDKIIK